jgi:hypothetical protein
MILSENRLSLFGIMRTPATGLMPFLVRLELRLQRGELGERRIRIGLSAASLFRIDPLARLVAAVLEVAASAFAARTAILPVAIRTLTAAALTRRRTAGALLGLVAWFAPGAASVTRAVVAPFGLRRLASG